MAYTEQYEVVVVGAGHAGCEAAIAAARMGLRTALFTLNLDLIAQMSCNPAIGGIAKGHLVREVDALGGVMGEVADAVGIQFRLLNTSRGPAVWSPRAQCDKQQYRIKMRQVLESQPGLFIKQAEVVDVLRDDTGDRAKIVGVKLRDGRSVFAGAVVITTGTFLNGLIHCGEQQYSAGRSGEPPAILLGEALKRLGLRGCRLKTGTPPRLDGRTIDWSRFEEQPGDPEPTPFSFRTREIPQRQVSCHIAHTTPETLRIIRENVSRSPMYSGQIHAVGPRYCPSIEDKVVRFPDKEQHQFFLEPEGLGTHEVYVNGMSTSLPMEVQSEIVHSIPGLENAEMLRPEEAACQGLMAGINAALKVRGEAPFTLDRTEGYTGILIDDLISKGTNEPYRMFTSRAEFRLHLRIDNADRRLTPYGRRLGLIDDRAWADYEAKQARAVAVEKLLGTRRVDLARMTELLPETTEALGNVAGQTYGQLLKRPEITIESLLPVLREEFARAEEATKLFAPLLVTNQTKLMSAQLRNELKAIETEIKYSGYLNQQRKSIDKLKKAEGRTIPEWFDYTTVSGLSREMQEKLARVRPQTLGQASRIPGVTPAALSLVNVYIEIQGKRLATAAS